MGLINWLRTVGKKTPPFVDFEGPAKVRDITTYSRYGPEEHDRLVTELIVSAGEKEYHIPFRETHHDTLRAENLREYGRTLRRQGFEGMPLYVRGKVTPRSSKRFRRPRIDCSKYQGTIEVNGVMAYIFDVDLEFPWEESLLLGINERTIFA